MFRFLKHLFAGKKEPSAAEISIKLSELEKWFLNARSEAKKELEQRLALLRERIANHCTAARQLSQDLGNASLHNPDIPEQAINLMRGNREEYCRRVGAYIDALAVPETPESLAGFFEQHEKDALDFTQGILKPFGVLQQFFADETRKATAVLGEIEKEIAGLKELAAKTKAGKDADITRQIQSLAAKHNLMQGLALQQAEIESEAAESEKAIIALEVEQERLQNDPDRIAAQQKVKEADELKRSHEQKLYSLFGQFEPGLRKFRRMATRNTSLVDKYLKNPVAAILEDMHLGILEAVSDIRRLLAHNRLDLGEKQADLIAVLPRLSREELGLWMLEYGRFSKAAKEADNAFSELGQSRTLERVKRLCEETKRTLQLSRQRIQDLQKARSGTRLEKLKAETEQKLTETTGVKVNIIIG